METQIPNLPISDFWYDLPDDRIARYPVPGRDRSKLLTCIGGKIGEDVFYRLPEYLASDTLLIGNETRVVQARLNFRKAGGALIELFCLSPGAHFSDIQLAFTASSPVEWRCLVGNSKRWKQGLLEKEFVIGGEAVRLSAERLQKSDDSSLIRFSWQPQNFSFSDILEAAGEVPLPPYLNRQAEEHDKTDYQTLFARHHGSVAAPTAGLHFTDRVLDDLRSKGIEMATITLHVGAGTFKPVSSASSGNHEMHAENIVVTRNTIERIVSQLGKPIIPVGTTSMRTLESLYWIGLKINAEVNIDEVILSQWAPYEPNDGPEVEAHEALHNILNFLDSRGLDRLSASTSLMIAPGYRFRLSTGLITNFHQPGSTLLLLVAALIGTSWKEVYDYALEHGFRFLSYGDSCLFVPE
jgi:S-adenosylmethionine:tRNA ribosyltransferase-isomerase